LRWTGLRRSDAISLTWGENNWREAEINRLTQKRKKRVRLPIPQELLFALEAERDRWQPQLQEPVLLHPGTTRALSPKRAYARVKAMGRRAGIANAHPHRFRDTFAVDMLARGASPYDVAKLLADTVSTIERHYAPFVKELRDRARKFMENGECLEKTAGTIWVQSGRRLDDGNENKTLCSGRACKPESSSTLVFLISCVESTNGTRQ
jgi:integrase